MNTRIVFHVNYLSKNTLFNTQKNKFSCILHYIVLILEIISTVREQRANALVV